MATPEPGKAALEATWLRADQEPSITPVPGVHIRSMSSENMMFIFVRLDPNAEVPHHQHVNEQAGAVIEGSMTITIGGESRTVSAGDAYLIPPNVPHAATTDERGCLVIDVFSPPREDYRMP